jgi:hypothetical protein
MKKPKVKLTGQNGNVFNLIGLCQNALRKAKLNDQAKELSNKIMTTAKSYDEALAIMMEYCEIS